MKTVTYEYVVFLASPAGTREAVVSAREARKLIGLQIMLSRSGQMPEGRSSFPLLRERWFCDLNLLPGAGLNLKVELLSTPRGRRPYLLLLAYTVAGELRVLTLHKRPVRSQ